MYCKSTNVDTSFLIVFAYKKTVDFRKPHIVNVMCCHNKCGQLDNDKCTSPLNCCHKAFTVPIDGKWCTTAFLHADFCRNADVPDNTHSDGRPLVKFWWNRALSFKIRIRKGNRTGQDFASFKFDTIKNNLRDYYAGNVLPYAICKSSDR